MGSSSAGTPIVGQRHSVLLSRPSSFSTFFSISPWDLFYFPLMSRRSGPFCVYIIHVPGGTGLKKVVPAC